MKRKIYHALIYLILRTLYATYRLRFTGLDNLKKAQEDHPQGSVIFALWHEHFLAGIFSIKVFKPCAMVSPSKDGEIVARFVRKLGYSVARGSSSRGGKDAKNDAITALDKGTIAAITVDGPKGPRNKAKPGIVNLSKISGASIIPISPITESPKIFEKSWDQNKFPKPFSKIVLRFGEPVQVPQSAEGEVFNQLRDKLDDNLIQTEKVAEGDFKDWKTLPKSPGPGF